MLAYYLCPGRTPAGRVFKAFSNILSIGKQKVTLGLGATQTPRICATASLSADLKASRTWQLRSSHIIKIRQWPRACFGFNRWYIDMLHHNFPLSTCASTLIAQNVSTVNVRFDNCQCALRHWRIIFSRTTLEKVAACLESTCGNLYSVEPTDTSNHRPMTSCATTTKCS